MRGKRIRPEIKKQLLIDWNMGFTTKQLAKKYGTNRRDIFRLLAILRAPQRPRPKILSVEEADDVVYAYKKGGAPYKLATKHGIGVRQVRSILRRRNIRMRDASEAARKYIFDESVFDVVKESSAYWAGFIAADGSLSGNRLNIGLAACDAGHLYKFRGFLRGSQPVTTRIGKSKMCGNFLRSEIVVTSRRLINSLRNLGIRDGKINRRVTEQLINNRHFWRGMIDGDGTFGVYRSFENNRLRIRTSLGFAGSRNNVLDFIDFAKNVCPRLNVTPRNRGNFYSVQITNRYTAELIRFLYGDANIALDRKMKIAHVILAAAPVHVKK